MSLKKLLNEIDHSEDAVRFGYRQAIVDVLEILTKESKNEKIRATECTTTPTKPPKPKPTSK